MFVSLLLIRALRIQARAPGMFIFILSLKVHEWGDGLFVLAGGDTFVLYPSNQVHLDRIFWWLWGFSGLIKFQTFTNI